MILIQEKIEPDGDGGMFETYWKDRKIVDTEEDAVKWITNHGTYGVRLIHCEAIKNVSIATKKVVEVTIEPCNIETIGEGDDCEDEDENEGDDYDDYEGDDDYDAGDCDDDDVDQVLG